MEINKQELRELLAELGRDDRPYFSDTMVLASNEMDPALPGLVWGEAYGTNSPRPSIGPWRSFQKPDMAVCRPVRPADLVIWLGQVLSAQLGRGIAVEILSLIVEHRPEMLDEIANLDRFK